jgi:uncharacterized membrane protein YbhN (UPF0104 family)
MRETIVNGVSGRSAFIVRFLGTALALILLIYLLTQQGWQEIEAAFRQIPFWRLALAMGLMVISRLAVSSRWYVLLRSGGVNISPGQALRVTFAGLFATNFLPTTVGGDVIRLAGALQLRFDAAVSAASLIVDRLVGMAGMAMVVPFGLPGFLAARNIQSGLIGDPPYLLVSYAAPLGKLWHAVWERGLRLVRKVLLALSLWLKQPRSLAIALIFTWVHMLCLFSVISVLLTGMDQDLSFWLVGGLYSIVYFVTLMPFSINGYGIQEVSMTFIFSTVGGASMESGLTAALLFRTMMMLASLPGAFFVPELLAGAKKQAGVTK